MKTNFINRLLTTILLISIVYISLINNLALLLMMTTIGFLVLVELNNLLIKIFYKKKKIIFFLIILSLSYITIFFTELYFFIIANEKINKLLFIYFLAICIVTDLGGYIFGKTFKGKKLTKISPNKTYSGVCGSYIFTFIIFLYFNLNHNFTLIYLLMAVLISSISQGGDLFISFLKRKAKVKDTGHLLPGHGGILDRIDGIIFAVPIGLNLSLLIL